MTLTSMLLRLIPLLSVYWDYVALIEPVLTFYIHLISVAIYVQILNAIPKPSYLAHRLGEWVTIPPRLAVDLEVVPFLPPFKPPTTSPADILFITTGCILMLICLFHLVIRSRALGSSFLLPLAILCTTGLSFLFALRIAIALDIPIHPTLLAHALPFLIALIGFDKPLRVANAIFNTNLAYALGPFPHQSSPAGSPMPVILFDSLSRVYPSIIHNYFFEIKILALAAYLPIGELRQLCALAALTLAAHYFVISAHFVPILSLILRSCALKLAYDIKSFVISSTPAPSHIPKRSYFSLSFLLGEKGTSFYNPKYSLESKTLKIITFPEKQTKNTAWRLKLVIFSSFLLFNFITPFTPSATLSQHPINPSTSMTHTNRTILDISSPPMAAILDALAAPDPGNELYIKLYPTPSTTPISASSFLDRLLLSLSLGSPILPDHTILSISFLAMVSLNVLLSISLAVFQSSIVIGSEGLMKFICGPGQDQPMQVRCKVWVGKSEE